MSRWQVIVSVVCVIGVCTLVSTQDVSLRFLAWPIGYLPGYLVPLLGYLAGSAAGWMLFASNVAPASSAPSTTVASRSARSSGSARWRSRSLIAALALVPLIIGGLASHDAVALSWPGYALGSVPGFLLPFAGFGLSFGPMLWSAWEAPSSSFSLPALVAGFLTVLGVGLALGLLQATAIFVTGVIAAVFFYEVFRRVSAGESLALESHWGGIGGGLGGWRLSPTGTLTLLALVFCALTIGAAVAWPSPGKVLPSGTTNVGAPKPGAQSAPRR